MGVGRHVEMLDGKKYGRTIKYDPGCGGVGQICLQCAGLSAIAADPLENILGGTKLLRPIKRRAWYRGRASVDHFQWLLPGCQKCRRGL